MEKKVYITDEERAKCKKVAEAFSELYEMADIVEKSKSWDFSTPTFEKSKLSSVNPLFKAFSDGEVWILL